MSATAPPRVYRQSLPQILLVHGVLIFVLVGCYTLPRALLRRAHTSLTITDRVVELRGGVLSSTVNEIPLARVDMVRLDRGLWDRMLGTGTLWVQAGGGGPLSIASLERAEHARREVQERADAARSR